MFPSGWNASPRRSYPLRPIASPKLNPSRCWGSTSTVASPDDSQRTKVQSIPYRCSAVISDLQSLIFKLIEHPECNLVSAFVYGEVGIKGHADHKVIPSLPIFINDTGVYMEIVLALNDLLY